MPSADADDITRDLEPSTQPGNVNFASQDPSTQPAQVHLAVHEPATQPSTQPALTMTSMLTPSDESSPATQPAMAMAEPTTNPSADASNVKQPGSSGLEGVYAIMNRLLGIDPGNKAQLAAPPETTVTELPTEELPGSSSSENK